MAELLQLIRSKPGVLSSDELAGIVKIYFQQLEETDLQALIDTYIPRATDLSIPLSLEIAETLLLECGKLQPKDIQLCCFYGNFLQTLRHNKICISEVRGACVDGMSEFKDIVGELFYKHLINYGLNGLLFLKTEEKPHRRYTYFHWVEYNIDFSQWDHCDCLPLKMLREVWSFKFDLALETLERLKERSPEDAELSSVEVGLRVFLDVQKAIVKNEQLKDKLIDRKEFQIAEEKDLPNKRQMQQFNLKLSQLKQQLAFGANYFSFISQCIKNTYFKAIAAFLANKEDNFIKDRDPTIEIQEISIVDRFFYARKFYRQEDFETLRKNLLQNYQQFQKIDYLVLFGGTRKQSEQILQNFMDERNEVQKVGVTCVVLKMLVEGAKIYSKDSRIAQTYGRFIKLYEDLLDCQDNGISKHNFRQKCIAMEVENKKKTMNKTFDFNCLNCKSKLCLISVSKRIAADSKQIHVKMKGHNVFSKDPRSQVMYCLDCMELLPKCAVCLYPVTTFNGYSEDARKNNPDLKDKKNSGESLDNALVWCPKCFHGGHFSHIMKWMSMSEKKKCPVFSCKCKCQL